MGQQPEECLMLAADHFDQFGGGGALAPAVEGRLLMVAQSTCEELIELATTNPTKVQWMEMSASTTTTSTDSSSSSSSMAAGAASLHMFQAQSFQTQPMAGKGFYKAVLQMTGNLQEVQKLYEQVSTEGFRASNRQFGPDFADAVLVQVLIAPTPEFPQERVHLKWMKMQSPVSHLPNRDFFVIERHQHFVDPATGRPGFAVGSHSIKLALCPSMEASHGFVRASLYRTGYVFTQIAPGLLEMVHCIQFDMKGNIPQWINHKIAKRRFQCMTAIDNFLQRSRMNDVKFLGDLELIPKEARSNCYLCKRKFGFLHRKCRCRICGEVVCMRCNRFWTVDLPRVGKKDIRICTFCSVSTRENISRVNNYSTTPYDNHYKSSASSVVNEGGGFAEGRGQHRDYYSQRESYITDGSGGSGGGSDGDVASCISGYSRYSSASNSQHSANYRGSNSTSKSSYPFKDRHSFNMGGGTMPTPSVSNNALHGPNLNNQRKSYASTVESEHSYMQGHESNNCTNGRLSTFTPQNPINKQDVRMNLINQRQSIRESISNGGINLDDLENFSTNDSIFPEFTKTEPEDIVIKEHILPASPPSSSPSLQIHVNTAIAAEYFDESSLIEIDEDLEDEFYEDEEAQEDDDGDDDDFEEELHANGVHEKIRFFNQLNLHNRESGEINDAMLSSMDSLTDYEQIKIDKKYSYGSKREVEI